ncbi:MAG TPA: ribbon-helix-helix domain-containing protein [Gemmataceae bacterium]|jgi:metal-responsive CopG/Arc/MetJ family transcriptional regulator|nr:ribbon-helix-helix domain-containing protein [Gemmataceae bacterium]
MRTAKIAITLDQGLLARLDKLVRARRVPSRSRVLQDALREKLDHLDRGRLERECAKLDLHFEQSLAEEGMSAEAWPEY